MPTKAITPTPPYILNKTLPPHKPETMWLTLMNYTNNSALTYPMCKRDTPPPLINIGLCHWISRSVTNNICTTQPSKKLAEKFIGPFEILAQVGSISFTLHLPNSMCGIHPIFHISMLEPSTPNEFLNQTETLPPPVIINREMEFEISEILDFKIDQHHKCKLQYLVKWSGYEGTEKKPHGFPCLNSSM